MASDRDFSSDGTFPMSRVKIAIGAPGEDDGNLSDAVPLPSKISSDVGTTFSTGATSSISTSAVQMTDTSTPCVRGVLVKAADANAGKVFVGASSEVTNGSADATDGLELGAGQSLFIPIDNANKIYLIGSAASQKVFWLAN